MIRMATAGEMIGVIAAAIARPQATVTSYYEVLRKGGLISTTGRGRSAQHLSPLDVARILIVMLSADALQEGDAVTRLVGQLWHTSFTSEDDAEPAIDIQFENALARIIAFEADQRRGRSPVDDGLLGNLATHNVQVRVTATHLTAEISFGSVTTEFLASSAESPPVTHPSEWNEIPIRDRLILRAMMEGMSVTRSIDNHVISKVAAAMP
ncbi:MAG: hypothetical protein ACK4I0_09510 [Brevundimonas sp.]|uniref:hypothetical protein n=1 Tax=Brevundimonas sp. TaxID=1871086 RepID=UPI00391B6F45